MTLFAAIAWAADARKWARDTIVTSRTDLDEVSYERIFP
jgi:hypothetical protein